MTRFQGAQTRHDGAIRQPAPTSAPNQRSNWRRHPCSAQRGVGRKASSQTTSHANRRSLAAAVKSLR
ncbi:hypothetical protein D9M69_668840 [compost metagenome]